MRQENPYTQKTKAVGKFAELQVRQEGFSGTLGYAGMSIEQASRFLGIGRSLIFEEIKAGRLTAKKAGRRTIIMTEDAIAYLRALPSVATQAT